MANEFITDLLSRRGKSSQGYNPVRFLEFEGATIIEPTAFEPDPKTYRGEFYYNAVDNILYRKVTSNNSTIWKKASD